MLINCPECGRQVSDKAEVCPHCGIRIAGNVSIRQQQPQYRPQAPYGQQPQFQNTGGNGGVPPQEADGLNRADGQQPMHPEKKSRKIWIFSFLFAVVIIGAGYYFYSNAQADKEQEAYEYAMQSNDPMVLQNYLSRYMEAPLEHRDSVMAHLNLLQNEDEAWNNAVASGSRGALTQYIEQNPDSPHVGEARNMIDSLDYAKASRAYKTNNDVSALQEYLTQHPDGRYADEVQELVGDIRDTQVSPAEVAFAKGVCRKFFQAINAKDAAKLVSCVSDILGSFLNRTGATSDDVVSFMNKLYKDDITNMNWHLGDDVKAEKVDDGMGGKNIQIQFSAVQNIERTDPTKEKVGNYTISAEVTQDGHITKFNMKKKVAE